MIERNTQLMTMNGVCRIWARASSTYLVGVVRNKSESGRRVVHVHEHAGPELPNNNIKNVMLQACTVPDQCIPDDH